MGHAARTVHRFAILREAEQFQDASCAERAGPEQHSLYACLLPLLCQRQFMLSNQAASPM